MKKDKNHYDATLPFQTIQNAARTTGLSQYYLRNGCRDGSIPHIMSGSTYMINMSLLLEDLNEQSKRARTSVSA